MRQRILRLFSKPWAPWLAVALGLLLCTPCLFTGLAADDFFHRLVLTGNDSLNGIHHEPFDLFVFSSGDPTTGYLQIDAGVLGWWADPKAAIAFFRPLSTLTHLVDYTLYPDSPAWMHAHNLFWFALGLCALVVFYRRMVEPAWVATLATLLYSVDDAHGFVVAWIANRNALIALALGVPVLVLHDAGRRCGRKAMLWVAPVLFGLSLLSGESAAAVLAYLFSYALFLDTGTRKSRAVSVLPYAAVFVVWRAAYGALGYGARGSGLAVDPLGDPLGFVLVTLDRLPALLLAQFAVPPADVWELYPAIADWLPASMRVVAVLAVVSVAWLMWPLIAGERKMKYWALGTVLAALPACAQVSSDRLLLYTGVGAAGLLAEFLAAVLGRSEALKKGRRAWKVRISGAWFFVAVHLVFAPYALPLRALGADDVTDMMAKADASIPKSPEIRDKTVVLVNPPADAFAGYTTMRRAALNVPRPKRLRWLATGASAVTLRRLDERTLLVTPADGFLSLKSEWMQRNPHSIPLNYRIDLTGMSVRVTALTNDGRPAAAKIRFEHPLEDSSYLWYSWRDNRLQPFSVPPIGGTVTLPAVDYLLLDR